MVNWVFIDDENVQFEFDIKLSNAINKSNDRYGGYKTVEGKAL